MKGYALLIGVDESRVPNVPRLRGAKFDVEKLSWMLDYNLNKQYNVKKLNQIDANWQNFKARIAEIKVEIDEAELFIYFTGHTIRKGVVNYLCFQDQEVEETEFLSTINMPNNFTVFIIINSCYAKELLDSNPIFNCPTYFLLSSGTNIESPASPTPFLPTYFTTYFIDTWQAFNYLNFNYTQFFKLLEKTIRKGLNISEKIYNDPNNFFGNNVPIKLSIRANNSYPAPTNKLFIQPDLYGYIQVDFNNPHNTYTILDSFTIQADLLNQNNNNDFVNALLKTIINEGEPNILLGNTAITPIRDHVKYIGIVLVKIGNTNGPYPHNINYMYSDGELENSNGLIVYLNIENNLQLVAHERTSGRVTNKIGGI